MSLRSSSQQPRPPVKCDRLQPRIEPVTEDLSPARGTARVNDLKMFDFETNFENTRLIPYHVVSLIPYHTMTKTISQSSRPRPQKIGLETYITGL